MLIFIVFLLLLFFFFSKRNVSTFAKTEPLFLRFSNANVSL